MTEGGTLSTQLCAITKTYCGKDNKFGGESGLRVELLKVKKEYFFCVMSHFVYSSLYNK